MLFLLAAALLVVGSLLGSPPSGPEEARMQTAAVWETELRKQRHYYRRHGDFWRRYHRTETPEPPVRPLSCGEFRFWDGKRCVDVRFR